VFLGEGEGALGEKIMWGQDFVISKKTSETGKRDVGSRGGKKSAKEEMGEEGKMSKRLRRGKKSPKGESVRTGKSKKK